MNAPSRINYASLREAVTPPVKEEQPIGVVSAADLVKVGGLYRIRDGYEAVWRMETDADGRRYISRCDSDTESPERLRVAEDDATENLPKAARTLTAGKCEKCDAETEGTKLCLSCSPKGTLFKDNRDKDDKSAYRVFHAGAVYVAWECEECATPNLTKFASNAGYECDQCHKKFANVLEDDRQPTKNIYTRAEVEVYEPEFAARMGRLGIGRAHVSLLQAWDREAKCDRCGGEGVVRPADQYGPLDRGCPSCGGSGKKKADKITCNVCRGKGDTDHGRCEPCEGTGKRNASTKKTAKGHGVCFKCGREYNGSECPTCSKKGAKAVNPWAVCHESVGPEKSDKFERCVKDVKKKSPIKD